MEENNILAFEKSSSPEVPAKEWRKPVLTIIPANSAENGPGALPDSGGIDYS